MLQKSKTVKEISFEESDLVTYSYTSLSGRCRLPPDIPKDVCGFLGRFCQSLTAFYSEEHDQPHSWHLIQEINF